MVEGSTTTALSAAIRRCMPSQRTIRPLPTTTLTMTDDENGGIGGGVLNRAGSRFIAVNG
jgi:hypothetical protein